MNFEEYQNYDALGLAELIKDRQLSPQELLETVISFTEQHNPKLNAVTMPMYDAAQRALSEQTNSNAPFFGVPFLLKDLGVSCKGAPTSNGNHILNTINANYDSDIVARFKQAGLIIYGKTNSPELGLSFTTEPKLWGSCHNPWDLKRTTGGSSGGAGAAVAARIIPVAHASDGGGSIRVPASCCGVFGLKPTRARTPCGPDTGDIWSGLGIHHVISRTVRDSAALLDAISGPGIGDPYYAPSAPNSFLHASSNPKKKKLTIAFSAYQDLPLAVDRQCLNALEQAVKLCEELGHTVIEDHPQWHHQEVISSLVTLIAGSVAMELSFVEQLLGRKLKEEDMELITWLFNDQGKALRAVDYATAVRLLQVNTRRIAPFYQKYDVMLTPTTALPAVPIGYADNITNLEEHMNNSYKFSPYTSICNITGQPAMSVPLYWTPERLPIGVQCIARFGDEATLFSLARQFEQAAPWDKITPSTL